jgi:CRP-like cAMP-binding protein
MYVIQEGEVEILAEQDGREVSLAVRGKGEMIGEMAIFEREARSATVRARGPVRALTVDKKTFLRRVQEDPSLAFRLVQTMSRRIRELNREVAHLRGGGAAGNGPAA